MKCLRLLGFWWEVLQITLLYKQGPTKTRSPGRVGLEVGQQSCYWVFGYKFREQEGALAIMTIPRDRSSPREPGLLKVPGTQVGTTVPVGRRHSNPRSIRKWCGFTPWKSIASRKRGRRPGLSLMEVLRGATREIPIVVNRLQSTSGDPDSRDLAS